ncbi:MAG: DM13 domain-containing protein [Proteobacteria bacterium]|nr:DM13 domain-containing protein [Pseudomonadota bacterium]
MKRIILFLFLGALGGAVAGFSAGIFIYPFWFLNDVAVEALAPAQERTELAQGSFIQPDPNDPVHTGTGNVTVFAEEDAGSVVFLHENFEVGPGPRFHVYLVADGMVRSRRAFLDAEKVDLGRLRNFRGSQVYAVPPGTDPTRYSSVVIWCKEFDVLISPADLIPAMAARDRAKQAS